MAPLRQIQEIVAYWVTRVDESNLGVDFTEAHERCWRCGYKSSGLEACHIIPKSRGGPDEPSNLVVLCGRCHKEAPNCTNPEFMWMWIEATHHRSYDMYWEQRGAEEFERMFDRPPLDFLVNMVADEDGYDEPMSLQVSPGVTIGDLFREEMKKTVIHFGEARMNPSTLAAVFYEVEQRIKASGSLFLR